MSKIDLTGKLFGQLTVLSEAGRNKHRNVLWNCQCECGNKSIVAQGNLSSGISTSCGCTRKKHGYAKSEVRAPEYEAWTAMRNRCNNANNPAYHNYGGRGIKVCQRWNDSVQNFIDDMGMKPNPDLSIDRINNDGDYTPENCRWATRQQQAYNRRPKKKAVYHTLNGVTKTRAEWSKELGIKAGTLLQRKASGWSDEKLLTTPVRGARK